jgi:hypothetical protein
MAEKEVARAADLGSHIKDPYAHGLNAATKAYVDAEGLVQITPHDITGDLTWDDTQRTLDLTSHTHANARWAIIGVYMSKTGDWRLPLRFLTVGGSDNIIQIGGDQSTIDTADGSSQKTIGAAGGLWIPISATQTVDYIAPSGLTAKEIWLLGYYKQRA